MYIGIMDIGTNALRASIFDDNKLGATEVYNKKFKTNLQNLLVLDEYEVPHQFYTILNHFVSIFKKYDIRIENINCVATHILRNEEGSRFVEFIKKRYGLNIRIVSGEEEACLSAYGVLSGINDPQGVVADLGGGSLELAGISNLDVGYRCSIPIGIRVIQDKNSHTVEHIVEKISENFAKYKCESLYFASGGFRSLGKIYQEAIKYPLKNLHRFEINPQSFVQYFERVISEKNSIAVDYYIIKVAIALVKFFNPKDIIISTYGLKDGIRFNALNAEERGKNIVIERSRHILKYQEKPFNFDKYNEFITPVLLHQDESSKKLIELAIIFLSMQVNIEPNLKASFLTQLVLVSDIPFSHKQRISLAIVIHTALKGFSNSYLNKISRNISTKVGYSNSLIIGKMLRILYFINGDLFEEPSAKIVKTEFDRLLVKTDILLPQDIFNDCKLLLRKIEKIQKCAKFG